MMTKKSEGNKPVTQEQVKELNNMIASMKRQIADGILSESENAPLLQNLEKRLFELTSASKISLIEDLKADLIKPIENLAELEEAIKMITVTASKLSEKRKGRPVGSKNKKN